MATLHTCRTLLRCFTPWLLWLMPALAPAQLLTVQGTTVSLTTGTAMHVRGGVELQGNAVVQNAGMLHLTGDFVHHATGTAFGNSQGTVVLDGGLQHIAGSALPVFNNLTLAGTGDKVLQRSIEVGGNVLMPAGVLQLGDRVLRLEENLLTVRRGNADAVQRTTGYIHAETDALAGYGTVRWHIGQQGVAGNTFVFPFGNASTGNYLPVQVTVTDPGMGIGGWLSLTTYPTDPVQTPNNRPLPTGLSALVDQYGNENAPNVLDRWWVMEAGGYAQAPVATVQFTYRDSEWNSGINLIAEPTLQLQDFHNGQWQYPPSVINTGANQLTSAGQSLRQGLWTASSNGMVLPVELLGLHGERLDGADVELRWSTATEHDNAGFLLRRRIDGESDFTDVAWIPGAGHSQSMLHYQHLDPNPTPHLSYYQLRQVDGSGNTKDSPVVVVNGLRSTSTILPVPNPARNHFTLAGITSDALREVQVLDATGRPVRQWAPAQLYPVSDLPAGAYLLRLLLIDGEWAMTRLVVQ